MFFILYLCEGVFNKIEIYLGSAVEHACIIDKSTVADPGFSKWGGAVLSQMGGRTSCFQVKSA